MVKIGAELPKLSQ